MAVRVPRLAKPDDFDNHPHAEGRVMRTWLKWMRGLVRNQDGVAAVEFALIAPAFFALLLAVIDVGRYMWVLNTMQYAIDEAVRTGVIRELPDDEIKDKVV